MYILVTIRSPMLKISPLFFLSLGLLPAQPAFPIEGRMIDDIRGQAIPNVRLVLSGDNLQIPLVTSTNPEGKFTFSVPAGRYKIAGEKAGFFPIPAEEIEVQAKVELGDITLTAKRSITGTVTWRDGEPAAGAVMMVYAIKNGTLSATQSLQIADDRGMFRVDSLRPGRYLVIGGSEAPSVIPRGITPTPRDAAAAIDLIDASESTTSVVFDERTGVDIEGKVVLTPNAPAGTSVTVELRIPGDNSVSVARATPRAGESFKLTTVPPGTYLLVATQSPQIKYGIQTIQVGTNRIRDLTITIPESAPLSGIIEVEDPGGPMPAANVILRAFSAKYSIAGPLERSDAKGDFRVVAAMADEQYQLTLDSLPPASYIASVKQAASALTKDPFLVTANGEPIRILLKKDGGKINGQLPPRGGLFRPAFVVLAPKDRQLTSAFKTIATDRKRAFQFSGIAPGAYELFAFDQETDYLGDESLKKYAARAVPVTVGPNSVLSVALEVVNGR